MSRTLSPSSRKNCWKTKPSRRARIPESWLSDMCEVSSPAMRTSPRVGRSRVPMTCRRVLFPDPDGPTIANELAGVHVETHPGEGHDRRVAGVLLDDVDQLQNRSRRSSLGKGPGGGHGHDEGTSTRVPTVMPDPLIWTRVLL